MFMAKPLKVALKLKAKTPMNKLITITRILPRMEIFNNFFPFVVGCDSDEEVMCSCDPANAHGILILLSDIAWHILRVG